ncbi:hypothetical protein [Siccirubricoccus deserti]|nr:hypothetical protein [Siccirubricoccus deserti]
MGLSLAQCFSRSSAARSSALPGASIRVIATRRFMLPERLKVVL